jgi:hypothetical protein
MDISNDAVKIGKDTFRSKLQNENVKIGDGSMGSTIKLTSQREYTIFELFYLVVYMKG